MKKLMEISPEPLNTTVEGDDEFCTVAKGNIKFYLDYMTDIIYLESKDELRNKLMLQFEEYIKHEFSL